MCRQLLYSLGLVFVMHILALLFTVVSGAVAWYWYFQVARNASNQVFDTVGSVRGALRRRDLRKKAQQAPLASIQEPAIAAVVQYLMLAEDKAGHYAAGKTLIRERMGSVIGQAGIDEVITFGEWVAKHVPNLDDPLKRFGKMWRDQLTSQERSQLVAIAEEVCYLGGEPTADQALVLKGLHTL